MSKSSFNSGVIPRSGFWLRWMRRWEVNPAPSDNDSAVLGTCSLDCSHIFDTEDCIFWICIEVIWPCGVLTMATIASQPVLVKGLFLETGKWWQAQVERDSAVNLSRQTKDTSCYKTSGRDFLHICRCRKEFLQLNVKCQCWLWKKVEMWWELYYCSS